MKYECLLDPKNIYCLYGTIGIISVNCKARICHSLQPLCYSNVVSSYLFAFSFLTRT